MGVWPQNRYSLLACRYGNMGEKRGLASAALGGYGFGNPIEEAIDVESSASGKTWGRSRHFEILPCRLMLLKYLAEQVSQ